MNWFGKHKIYLRSINKYLYLVGLNLKKTLSLINLFKYLNHYLLFKKLGGKIKNLNPKLDDFKYDAGDIKKNYEFHADLLTSQRVFQNKPTKHLDIGSKIDGLVSQIASYRELDVIDIRGLDIRSHKNINFIKQDILQFTVSNEEDKYDSISSNGVLGHVGLGRYGDNIDPCGYKKAIKAINNLSKQRCTVYTYVPVGKKGVEFNAHTIFDPHELINEFEIYNFKLKEFHLINDEGDLILNYNKDHAKDFNFAGGYFVFTKE